MNGEISAKLDPAQLDQVMKEFASFNVNTKRFNETLGNFGESVISSSGALFAKFVDIEEALKDAPAQVEARVMDIVRNIRETAFPAAKEAVEEASSNFLIKLMKTLGCVSAFLGAIWIYRKTDINVARRLLEGIVSVLAFGVGFELGAYMTKVVQEYFSEKVHEQIAGASSMVALITAAVCMAFGMTDTYVGHVVEGVAKKISHFPRMAAGIEAIIQAFGTTIQSALDTLCDKLGVARWQLFAVEFADVSEWSYDVATLCDTVTKGVECNDYNMQFIVGQLVSRGNMLAAKYVKHSISASINGMMNRLKPVCERFPAMNGDVGFRPIPVSVLVRGGPGKGKSTLVQKSSCLLVSTLLGSEHGKRFLTRMSQYLFIRNPDCEFWDGYFRQFIVFYDDFLQKVDVAGMSNSGLMEFIASAQGFPFHLPMAKIEQKQDTYFASPIIMGTTNIMQFGPEVIKSVHSPMAVNRRWDIDVDIAIKPQFSDNPGAPDKERKIRSDLVCHGMADAKVEYWELIPHRTQEVHGNIFRTPCDAVFKWKGKTIRRNRLSFTEFNAWIVSLFDERAEAHMAAIAGVRDMIDLGADLRSLDLYNDDEIVPQMAFPCIPSGHWCRTIALDAKATETVFLEAEDHLFITRRFPQFESTSVIIDFCREIHLTDYPPESRAMELRRAVELLYTEKIEGRDPFCVSLGMDGKQSLTQVVAQRLRDEVCELRAKIASTIETTYSATTGLQGSAQRAVEWMQTHKGFVALTGLIAAAAATTLRYYLVGNNNDSVSEEKDVVMVESDYAKKQVRRKTRVTVESNESPDVPPMVVRAAERLQVPFNEAGGVELSGDSVELNMPNNETIFNQGGFDKTGEDIAMRVRKNVYWLGYVEDDAVVRFGRCLGVEDRVFLMPYHYIRAFKRRVALKESSVDSQVRMWSCDTAPEFGRTITIADFLLNFKSFDLKDKHKDAVLVQLPIHVPQVPSIVKYLMTESNLNRPRDWYIHVDVISKEGTVCYASRAERVESQIVTGHDERGEQFEYPMYEVLKYFAKTRVGDCGSPCFVVDKTTGGQKLLGIHIAGSELGRAFSVLINKETMVAMLNKFEYMVVPQMEDAIQGFRSYSQIKLFDTLHKPFDDVNFRSVAKLAAPVYLNTESKLEESDLYESWGPSLYLPARMKPFQKDGVLIDPLAISLAKYGRSGCTYVQPKRLVKAVRYISSKIRAATFEVPRKILTFNEAMLGVEGDEFAKGVTAKSSPGYPWKQVYKKKGKTDFVVDGALVEGKPLDDLRHDVDEITKRAARGERPPIVYLDFFKDERRPIEKVLQGKTRMISASPLDYTVVFKQYFGAFASALTQARHTLPPAVGMNVYSEEWHELAVSLLSKGGGVEDGDFSGYDTSQSPQLLWAVFDIIHSWYDDEHHRTRQVLWNDIVGAKHVLRGNIYEMVMCLPSGNPLTVHINSIITWLAYTLAWLDSNNDDSGCLEYFDSCVFLKIYGDDSIFSVSPYGATHFNAERLPMLMKNLGFNYTSASKDGLIREGTRTLNEVSFLKRGFRFEEAIGRYVCPLAEDVVRETPYWCKSDTTRDATLVANVRKSIEEASLHGPEFFYRWAPLIACAAEQLNMGICHVINDFGIPDSCRTEWLLQCVSNIEEY